MGLARVLWIGKVSKLPETNQPTFIQVYWVEIQSDVTHPDFNHCAPISNTRVRCTNLPIGYLTLLHVNAILHKGKIVDPWPGAKLPFEKSTCGLRRVDFSRSNLTLFNRRDTDQFNEPILKIKTDRLKDYPESNTKCLGVRVGDDPYAIIFSCAELLRFFYCTSTKMASVIFDGRIDQPSKYLYDDSDNKSFGPINGHVFITLRRGMLDSDAHLIASMFSDPEVLQCAQSIRREAAKDEGQFRNFLAYPPFDGAVDLEFLYIPIQSKESERIFVTRITKSYHKSNFQHLKFDRELNEGNGGVEDSPDEQKIPTHDEESKNKEEPYALENETYSDPRLAFDFRKIELGNRFPEIARIPVTKVPPSQPSQKNKRRVLEKIDHSAKNLSSAHGKGDDKRCRKIEIQSPANFEVGPTNSRDISIDIGANTYKKTIKLLRLAKEKKKSEVYFLENILPHFAIVDNTYFNVYAVKSNDYRAQQKFHLIDKSEGKARMVLVVKLVSGTKTRFLIDFQQKQENEVSYQVFWFKDEKEPEDIAPLLKEALYCYAATKTAGGKTYINIQGLLWGSFKHKQDEVSDTWIIEEVFGAQPKPV